MPALIDLTGRTFGRWSVLTYSGESFWLCECSCEKQTKRDVKSCSLLRGLSTSCGCFFREEMARLKTTHGLRELPEYKIWQGIKKRCENVNDHAYRNYGARGICVCNGWQKVENFIHDMGLRPSPDYSIERIDNNGNYSCGHCEQCTENKWNDNCHWATLIEQANNTRQNHLLTFHEKTMNVTQWSKEVGIKASILFSRIYQNWSMEEVLTHPVGRKRRSSM